MYFSFISFLYNIPIDSRIILTIQNEIFFNTWCIFRRFKYGGSVDWLFDWYAVQCDLKLERVRVESKHSTELHLNSVM